MSFLLRPTHQSHQMFRRTTLLLLLAWPGFTLAGKIPAELRIGIAGHAFDHLGNIGEQSAAAAASGANIIYVTGLGACGYQGLTDDIGWTKAYQNVTDYTRAAKKQGIKLSLGYVCATSIVKLDEFDKNWSPKFRALFKTPPADWLQQDRDGKLLPSWYGGDYRPACMNNPDWRAYERAIVGASLRAGCDGIFFDNPTVHPQGCYCRFCLEKFATFLGEKKTGDSAKTSIEELRRVALARTNDFRRFRTTTARDFFAEMRDFARSVKRGALITANNSLNSADALFSQARTYGYSIYEMSQAEDFVVVEDMSSQPRTLADGRVIEYGPTYKQLHAISHGKPVVAVTIADGDYHTPPNLVRLAMAEAAAHGASYLSWPTWPENQRARMSAAIRPQADSLQQHEKLLNETTPRSDAVLFLPMRRYLETDKCRASDLAAALTRANIQYTVVCEDDLASAKSLPQSLKNSKALVIEPRYVLAPHEQDALHKWERKSGQVISTDSADWLKKLETAIGVPSIVLRGPPTVRAVVHDQGKRTIVHLLNLNVQKISSFEDKMNPVSDVRITVRVPSKTVRSVRALTADTGVTRGLLAFTTWREGTHSMVEIKLDRLEIATILVYE